MTKYIPVSKDGRFLLRVGRWTKAEEDEFFSRQAGAVAFTRSGPPPEPTPPTPLPAPQSPESAEPRPAEPRRTAL